MRLEFHRLIASDISSIMMYYEDVGGPKLADKFYSELRQFFQNAANNPETYSLRERDLRRVNLETFCFICEEGIFWRRHYRFLIVTKSCNDHRAHGSEYR